MTNQISNRIHFRYGEFYDYPRMLHFQFGGEWYYLSSKFDEDKDDYPDSYDVYLLPFRTEEEFSADPFFWMDLSAALNLGQLSVESVGFDKTRRETIDAKAFENWLREHKN